jgi:hypothetical protein
MSYFSAEISKIFYQIDLLAEDNRARGQRGGECAGATKR